MPGIVFAVTGGAAAAAVPVALLCAGLPPDGGTILVALGLWLYLVVGIVVVLPLWEVLYRWGCRRWWQASAFGAVTGFAAMLLLTGDVSDYALGAGEVAAIASAIGGVVVWWLAYRPPGRPLT